MYSNIKQGPGLLKPCKCPLTWIYENFCFRYQFFFFYHEMSWLLQEFGHVSHRGEYLAIPLALDDYIGRPRKEIAHTALFFGSS